MARSEVPKTDTDGSQGDALQQAKQRAMALANELATGATPVPARIRDKPVPEAPRKAFVSEPVKTPAQSANRVTAPEQASSTQAASKDDDAAAPIRALLAELTSAQEAVEQVAQSSAASEASPAAAPIRALLADLAAYGDASDEE